MLLKRQLEAARGARFSVVLLQRVDLIWRTPPPFMAYADVAASMLAAAVANATAAGHHSLGFDGGGDGSGRLVVLPQHCEPQGAALETTDEARWKAAVCGGRALPTLASPIASGCVAPFAATSRGHRAAAPAAADDDEGSDTPLAADAFAAHHAPSHRRRTQRLARQPLRPKPSASSVRLVGWEATMPGGAGTHGACDERRLTPAGRSHYLLPWWVLFPASSALADEFAHGVADPASFAHVSALTLARLTAQQAAPNPWSTPAQFSSAGVHWAWKLRHGLSDGHPLRRRP
jgi:hypothetical protein